MTAERTRRCELAQLVAYHVFRNKNRNERPAVMYRNRYTHHLGQYRRAARPRADYLPVTARHARVDFFSKVLVHVRAFLY